MSKISQRKDEHIRICIDEDPSFKIKTTGFEEYEFIHNALPELDFDEIEIAADFFGKKISAPFLISCMTGGFAEADNINAALAEAAKDLNIPIGVGSQRQLLENDAFENSFRIVKDKSGDVPVLGNIGGQQLLSLKNITDVKRLVDVIEADAMVVHLNPSQELIQKGGDTNFKGIAEKIESLVKSLPVPIIVKEVGAGIAKETSKRLLELGVSGIDVAGAGGTSWSAVESLANGGDDNPFWDWGLPTSYCVKETAKLKSDSDFLLIASGGIMSGIDVAKSISLGADIAASARPVLLAYDKNGIEGVINLLAKWFDDLKKAMLLTGSKNLFSLRENKLIKKSELF
ncbi:MAG: type 2 isopentenyl-diphosphate Delta-isomerase [Chlorobi bacterium]|nr:type 2 isopentenyl-diphosphate Delta-isomerase [Chlorobiota bacterium]